MGRRIKILLITVCAATLLLCDGVWGQNNPYKISDSLFKIYTRAYDSRYNINGVTIADTLMREAVRLDDKKAQCLALTIPVIYHSSVYNGVNTDLAMRQIRSATNSLKEKAKATGYEQYYYYAESMYVSYLLSVNKIGLALTYVRHVMDEANRTNSKYGVFTSYRMMGNLYMVRNERTLAVKNYVNAYNYAKVNVPDEDLGPICFVIARTYMYLGKYDDAHEYAKLALKISKTRTSEVRAQTVLCMSYFLQGRYDDFLSLYNGIVNSGDREYLRNQYWPTVRIMYQVAKGNYATADSLNALNSIMNRLYYSSIIESRKGNYKRAVDAIMEFDNHVDSNDLTVSNGDMILQQSGINRHVLDMRNRQLQVDNERLSLQKLKLDVDAANNEAEAVRLNAESNQIKLQQRTLETKMKENELEKVKAERTKQSMSERNYGSLRLLAMATAGVLAVFFLIYLIRYIRKERQLAATNRLLVETNDELTAARNAAEEADRMKSLFLQNMSHEVRTPLNAIVGFSQILAEGGDDFGDEEKADFAARIEENSDLVERLINDILMLTSIESGKYQVQTKSIPVNSMCREVIDSVRENHPTKLEIRYTYDVDDGYVMNSDRSKVQYVIDSLLANSIKNTEKGFVQLDFSAKKKPGYNVMTVTDSGVGITEEEADKIFERFYKTDDFKQGVGLGLSICEAIAERLNGEIFVDTSYKDGARFVFEIPVV